ncbi:cytochrome c3 family protein [Desulfobaculum bizertense]|uniref:Cytochrome c-type protein n=1 Tax=Desulfobaculum bizertense DSM 18034 TaxID=1121442 RepID=A0A1T4WY57_9BACT|nr:NapC/NirT family cytochrome c [Desulfobaculum bizertense]UIJ39511.1 NapC/NirT family cytochrome c [Desulfobaculum bizertense]SKA82290.1 cytochrome c-type protein NapC [Desulfobaculum bizertense DSM 18034]
MKKLCKSLLCLALGIILAFPIFSLLFYTMVRTSTPQFCASCHEIHFAYNTWRTSSHVNNGQGVVADCMDCHLPAPHDMVNFFYMKTAHGIRDVGSHIIKGSEAYDNAEQREKAYATFKNEQCQKCHRNILYIPNNRGAMLAHRAVLYPREGYEKKCVDCHRNLVHNPRPFYDYKQYRLNAGLAGL